MDKSDILLEKLKDKKWRMNNLYLILPENTNVATPLTLRDEQIEYLNNTHNKLFIPKARKLGLSTIIVLDFLDECIFNKNTQCGHLDLRESDCTKKLQIALFAWINGPKHPDPAIAVIWKYIHEKIKLVRQSQSTLEWSNNSRLMASMSFTGTTPTRLHLSEFAVLADDDLNRALKIIQGTLNAVPITGFIVIESTMRSAVGPAYDLFKLALSKSGQQLSPLDWKFMFFPWFNHPSYRTPVIDEINETTRRYALSLKIKHNIDLTEEQLAWYQYKSKEQGRFMKNEFPSVPEECIQSQGYGAIYPEMTTLRSKNRVTDLAIDRNYPLYVSADLGISDRTAMWIVQFSGRDILWHRFYMSGGHGAAGTAQQILKWEKDLNIVFNKILLPHDANTRDRGSGKTYVSQLNEAGLSNNRLTVINRTANVWDGINWFRDNIDRMYFDVACDKPTFDARGESIISGLNCLEAYKTNPNIPDSPYHDKNGISDACDAARTFSQAVINGIVSNRDTREQSSVYINRPKAQKGDFIL